MAEGPVNFLLGKLSEFVQNEGGLLASVRVEAEYITDELNFIKAFLRITDAMQESDPVIKEWVKQLRDLAHDMEDALDDFRLRIAQDSGHNRFYKMGRFIMNLKARHQIASKLQLIKTRVINISEAHRRYFIKYDLMRQGSMLNNIGIDRQGDALLLEEADLVGIDQPRNELIKRLVDGKRTKREVIPVVGMGGLGKTTLVKKVYEDADVKNHFKFRAWITVSQSSKTEDLLKDIIQEIYRAMKKPIPPEMGSMKKDEKRMWIKNFLQKKRYLIVLDDVWHIEEWEAVENALSKNSNGSRVLLTTRAADVASTCCKEFPNNEYYLKALSMESAWTLFCKKVFQNEPCPPHLREILENILKRCEGLPLAIVSISGVLATKDKCRKDQWEMVHRCLGTVIETNDELTSTRQILSLSYDDLPYYLKHCLLYLSIFPEGTPIEHMRLVRLWMAEGFVIPQERMTLEEVAQDYLIKLIKRSLVQVVEATSDGRVKSCRIHDLLREIIISKSKAQEFVAIAKEQSMIWPEKVRRVSIHNAAPGMPRRHVAARLRSMLMFWGLDSSLTESLVPDLAFRRLRLLNVLQFQGVPLTEFPKEIFNLTLLKYLCLRNTEVQSIPSSIGKLQNLETLDLKHSRVAELPTEILKLQKLRHLLVYRYDFEDDDPIFHTKYGFKAPAKIGGLGSLQKLCFIETNQANDLMTELGTLIHLTRLGVVNLRRKDGKILCSSIEKLGKLHALSVTSMESEIIDMEYLSSPPPFLQRLYLAGQLEKLPDWISALDSLVKLGLKWSMLSADPLQSLQHLPNLVHLEFVEVYSGELLCFKANGFQKLKFLGLNKLNGLKIIIAEQGAMPCLEKLIVQNCKLLHSVPTGIEYMTNLKVLEFFDMPCNFIERLRPDGEGEDYLKIQNVQEVYATYQIGGIWKFYSAGSFRKGRSTSGKWKP